MRAFAIVVATLLLASNAGCRTRSPDLPDKPRPSVTVGEPEEWREVASVESEAGVDGLDRAWEQALEEARQKGLLWRLAAGGSLLRPGGGLPRAAPAPGAYRCKVVRLGTHVAGAPAFAQGRQGFCFIGIQDDRLSLTTEVAGARFGGHLWETKGSGRLVFLGAIIPAGARIAPAYGADAASDRAGLFERIGEFRYRLTIPTAGAAQRLVIFDLVAAPRP